MRPLLISLLVTLALPAAAETVGELDVRRPGQWGVKIDEASGAATFFPYGSETPLKVAVIVLPPEKSELSRDAWLDTTWKAMLTGSKVLKDEGSAELGTWKHRTAQMEGSAGKKWIRLYAVKTTKGMQAVFYMAETKALFDEHSRNIDTMVREAGYHGKPLPTQPRIKVAYRGIMMRSRYDLASKSFRQKSEIEHLVLFEDGKALRAWPERGVAWEDVSADAAKEGDSIGSWTDTGQGIVFRWHEGSETVTTREGDVLVEEQRGRWIALPDSEGSRPEGTFERKNPYGDSVLTLRRDGTFRESGVLGLLTNVTEEKLPKSGKGTYEIRACTLLLTYEDGTTKSIAYEVMEGTAEKPLRIALNTSGLDVKR